MFFSLANLSTSGFLALASCLGHRLLGVAPRLGPSLTSVLLTSGSLGVREMLESDSKLSYPERKGSKLHGILEKFEKTLYLNLIHGAQVNPADS